MRTFRSTLPLAALLLCAAFAAQSQSAARPRPPGTVPLEEPPPLPSPGAAASPAGPAKPANPALEPQVTIRQEGDLTIAEYRVNGKLYMQRVTPRSGRPYVLMDQKGDGTFSKQDNTLSPHVAVPQWVLAEF